MQRQLNFVAYGAAARNPPVPVEAVEVVDINAFVDAIEDVKVQFFSLGLIEPSARRHQVTDKNSYWTLTESGRAHLMRSRARRKKTPPEQAASD